MKPILVIFGFVDGIMSVFHLCKPIGFWQNFYVAFVSLIIGGLLALYLVDKWNGILERFKRKERDKLVKSQLADHSGYR